MTQTQKMFAAVVGGGAALWWLIRSKPKADQGLAQAAATGFTSPFNPVAGALAQYGANPPSAPQDVASGSVVKLSPITLDAAGFGGLGGPGQGGDMPQTTPPLSMGAASTATGVSGPVFDPTSGLMIPYR